MCTLNILTELEIFRLSLANRYSYLNRKGLDKDGKAYKDNVLYLPPFLFFYLALPASSLLSLSSYSQNYNNDAVEEDFPPTSNSNSTSGEVAPNVSVSLLSDFSTSMFAREAMIEV